MHACRSLQLQNRACLVHNSNRQLPWRVGVPKQHRTTAARSSNGPQHATDDQAKASQDSSSSSSNAAQEWEQAWRDDDEAEEAEEEVEEAAVDDDGDAAASFLRQYLPSQQQQAVMLELLQDEASQAATLGLGSAGVVCGLNGSLALGLGWLLGVDVLSSFRWDAHDLGVGLLWALPAAAVAALLTLAPLPPPTPAAAAAAAIGSTSSSSSGRRSTQGSRGDGLADSPVFREARRMARHAALADDLELQVEVPLPFSAASERGPSIRPVSRLSWSAVLRSLRFTQEALVRPWDADVRPPSAKVLGFVEQQLRRLTQEVVWRGLVATGLAGLIYSSWSQAGTSQDSLFFYARLFGLLTPQAGLAAAVGLMLAARIPLLWLSGYSFATYTRLSALKVSIVGQLTDSEWLLRVQPSETAAAVAGSSGTDSSSSSSKGEEMRLFGRLKQQQEAAGEANAQQEQEQEQQLSKQQLDARLDELLAAAAAFGVLVDASSSSSSKGSAGSHKLATATASADDASSLELRGTQLLAELLDLSKDLDALAAASGAGAGSSSSSNSSSSSSSSMKLAAGAAAKTSEKLNTAGNLVLAKLNDIRDQRYFICHMGDAADDAAKAGSSSSSDEDDEDEDDDLLFETGAAAFRRRLQERLASLAAEQRRQQWLDKMKGGTAAAAATASSSSSGGAAAGDKRQKRKASSSSAAGGAAAGRDQRQQQLAAPTSSSNKGPSLLRDVSSNPEHWQVLKKMMEQAASAVPRSQILAQGWSAAANVPTAEDRCARWLLLVYAFLGELAPAGAFVATGGNAAASAAASAAYNALAVAVNEVGSQRARQAVREALGADWLLKLLPLQPGFNDRG